MSKSIKVSKEHGVNPTIPVCFWCGKEKNEIALLGRLPGDKEAPMNMILDYEPCDNCREGMARGITVMEAVTDGSITDRPEMQEGVVPTGRWLVFNEDYFKRNTDDKDLLKVILDKRKMFMSVEDFTPYIDQFKELQEEAKNGEE